MYIKRHLEKTVIDMSKAFPAVLLTGLPEGFYLYRLVLYKVW